MKRIKKIFNSYISIIVSLSILVIALLAFNIYLVKSEKIYTFTGASDDLSILSGTIYSGNAINRFQAPNVIYSGKDIVLVNAEVGYYISDRPISIIKIEEELYLKDIINSADFSFTEMRRKALKLNKKNMNDIEKLNFKISGAKKSGENIVITVPLKVTYLGK